MIKISQNDITVQYTVYNLLIQDLNNDIAIMQPSSHHLANLG